MIGIDLIKIDRIQKFHERFGDKALKKFLDQDEITLGKSINTYAGFYAAKEAISKALGIGISKNCGFRDIKIYKDENGAPFFTLSKHLVEEYSITDMSLSITHEAEYAVAVATIESQDKKAKKLFH